MANLKIGSKGSSVKQLQNLLNQRGYNLTADGVYGSNTMAAVKDFQKRNGLAVDGVAGELTLGSLTGGKGNDATADKGFSYKDFTYDDFKEPADFKYDDFSYDEYKESDTVKGAQNALNAHLANKPAEYKSQWQSQLDTLMGQIMNRDKFSYDLNGDVLYQQYKDKYIQQGKLAMADTMGQAAAMTGGYGSSYAQSVGQQAYQGQLDNLNDVVPELYAMALDKYNREGQDLYNQYGMVMDRENLDYGRYRDTVSDYLTDRDYLTGRYDSERGFDYGKYVDDRNFDYGQYADDRNFEYGKWADDRTFDYNKYSADRNLAYDKYDTDKTLSYNEYRAAIEDAQWQRQYDESVRQYNEQMAFSKQQYEDSKASSGGSGGGNGGNGGNGGEIGSGANILWNATGTTDSNGNPIFRNSEGKTQAFGQGINPYTGTKHPDAKHGTFSNGYQPNNIGGTKLKNSGMSTSITGKNQTIWEANGKYWLWRGDLNKYIEVDVSDLD